MSGVTLMRTKLINRYFRYLYSSYHVFSHLCLVACLLERAGFDNDVTLLDCQHWTSCGTLVFLLSFLSQNYQESYCGLSNGLKRI